MKKSYKLFVGCNNETKELETKKIIEILGRFFEGFTIETGQGFYKGKQEPTAILSIFDNEKTIKTCAVVLRRELKQECIGMQLAEPISFI